MSSEQGGSPGPGYWQGDDGTWNPPATGGAAPPPPPVAQSRAEAKADAKASAARAKALRPWFKKKRFVIPLVLVVVAVAGAALGGGGDDQDTAANGSGDATDQPADDANSSETDLWDRPDEKDGDKEREIGGAVDLSGYTVTVASAAHQAELTEFEKDGYIVADVTLLNRDSSAQSYNTYDWKLITPSGSIIDPYVLGDQLGSGDLASGGTITGKIIFEDGGVAGDYYLVYDPDFGGDNRGIWKVIVP